MAALLSILRDGSFLTRERIRLWTGAILLGFAAGIAALWITAHGLNDYRGRPLGTDFSDVYAAGTLALAGAPEAAFDPQKQFRQEQKLFGDGTLFYGWHYPPFFLIVAAALAHLPYLPALLLWQISTLAIYLGAMRMLLRRGPVPAIASDRIWLLGALAFPAVFVNLIHGHNGFMTAALIATALAMLDTRPILSGILFGLLAYKPQFGLMIPLVLAVTARWKCFGAAAATVAVLTLAVTALFGEGIWPAFLSSTHFTREVVLEQGGTGFHKIQSVFAWARMWGGPVAIAYAAQAIVTLCVAAALAWLWRSGASAGSKGAALCIAVLLATPYSLDYDMMVLAPAIALLAADGIARGFRPYERTALAALWFMPIVAREFAGITHVPLGVPAMLAVFALALRRGLVPACPQSVPAPA